MKKIAVRLLSSAACTAALLSPAVTRAQSSTTISHSLLPVADTYIRGGSFADNVHGVEEKVYVKNHSSAEYDRMAYLRFSMKSLKATSATNVKLNLTGRTEGNADSTLKLYGLTSDGWSETLLTWNNASPTYRNGEAAPSGATLITSFVVPKSATDVTLTPIDVTSFVNGQMGGDKIVTFLILRDTVADADTVVIRSREFGTVTSQPRLTFNNPVAKLVLNPIADTYVQNGTSTGVNYGTSADLKLRHKIDGAVDDRLVYLKFDRSALTDTSVRRATLRTYVKAVTLNQGSTSSNTVRVYGLGGMTSDSWTETGANWDNTPNHHFDPASRNLADVIGRAKLLTPNPITVSSGDTLQIDVTNLIAEKRSGVAGTVQFMIMPEPGSPNVNFYSKEDSNTTKRPTLRVTASPPAGPYDQTKSPTGDVYVRSGIHANVAHGTTDPTRLGCTDNGADYQRIAFLSFDISDVPQNAGIEYVTGGTLTLHVSGADANNAFRIYSHAGAFAESSVTWANNAQLCHDTKSTAAIRQTDMVATGQLLNGKVVGQAGQYYEFDVTDFVNKQKVVSADNVLTFMLEGGYSVPLLVDDIETTFASREDVAAKRPELVIEPTTLTNNLTLLTDKVVDNNGLVFDWGGYGLMPNTAVSVHDIVRTHNGYQYAVYYNSSRQVCVARRPLGGNWETLALSGYTFNSHDNHNYVSMGICPNDGTIHVSFDHHVNNLHYVVSSQGVATNPASYTWSSALFGAVRDWLVSGSPLTQVTYPHFVTQPDGNLLFNYRREIRWRHLYRYNGSNQTWAAVGTGTGQYFNGQSETHTFQFPDPWLTPTTYNATGNRRAYTDEFAYDADGGLHMAWCWREDNGLSKDHDLMYAHSADNGATWRSKAGGTLVATTGTEYITLADTAATLVASIPETRNMRNNGSFGVDPLDRVHIIANYDDDGAPSATNNSLVAARRYHHHWRDEKGVWRHSVLPYYGARPKMVTDFEAAYVLFPAYDRIVVAKATRVADYQDWEIINLYAAPTGYRYTAGTPSADLNRLRDSGILSIFTQDEQTGATSSPVRVIEYLVNY